MSSRTPISRQGLVSCPSCQTHIKAAPVLEETHCPFCECEPFAAGVMAAPQRMSRRSRRGLALLSAAVIGTSLAFSAGMTACGGGGDTEQVTESTPQDSGTPPAPAYGIPPQDAGSPDSAAPDTPVAPAYGIPAPD